VLVEREVKYEEEEEEEEEVAAVSCVNSTLRGVVVLLLLLLGGRPNPFFFSPECALATASIQERTRKSRASASWIRVSGWE